MKIRYTEYRKMFVEHVFSLFFRWVKYEETVEEGGKRWSKPHVASLSFHYVMEMRKCLLEGAFLVDVEAYSMSQVIGEYRAE